MKIHRNLALPALTFSLLATCIASTSLIAEGAGLATRASPTWEEYSRMSEQEKAAELARERALLKQVAEDSFQAVTQIFNEEHYPHALREARKLRDIGWTEQEYLDRVEKLERDIQEKSQGEINKLIARAKEEKQKNGDLAKAREYYTQALNIDPDHAEAALGFKEIRQLQFRTAKNLYEEATLAESVGDFSEAKKNYERCFQAAPKELNIPIMQDLNIHCRRKLIGLGGAAHEPTLYPTDNPLRVTDSEEGGTRLIPVGMIETLHFELPPLPDPVIGNKTILEAHTGISPNESKIIPLKKGKTSIVFFLDDGKLMKKFSYNVITNDLWEKIQEIRGLLQDIAGISVGSVDDKIVVDGHILDPRHMSRITSVASAYKPEVINLVTLDQRLFAYRAKKMENTLHKESSLQQVRVIYENNTFGLLGRVGRATDRDLAEGIAKILVPTQLAEKRAYPIRNLIELSPKE